MPHDRLAKADASMRALGYRRRKRKADMIRLNTVETELAGLVGLAGPLPAANSGAGGWLGGVNRYLTAGNGRRWCTGAASRGYRRIRTLAPSTTSSACRAA